MSFKSGILIFIQFSCILFFLIDYPVFAYNYLVIFQLLSFLVAFWGVIVMKFGKFNIQPELKIGTKLVVNGPYKFIRNPMYSGIIFFFLVSVLNHYNFYRMFIFLILILVLSLKIRLEERFLVEKFGKSYLEYKAQTKRFIPFVF